MSGHIPEGMSREEEGYKQMVNKVKRVAHTSNVENIYDSRVGSSINATQQHCNATLVSQQFSQMSTNKKNNFHVPAEILSKTTNVSEYAPSDRCGSVYPASDTYSFKMPQPVRNFNAWSHYREAVDCLMFQVRQIEDKAYVKFFLRFLQLFVHKVYVDQQTQINDPIALMDYISSQVKEKYHSRQACRPGSSMSSTITSQMIQTADFYGNNPVQSIPTENLDRLNSMQFLHGNKPVQSLSTENLDRLNSMQFLQPNVVLNALETAQQQTKNCGEVNNMTQTTLPRRRRTPLNHKQPAKPPVVMDNSSLSLFNESLIAQRRDENAVKQSASSTQSSFTKAQTLGKVKNTPVSKSSQSKVKRSSNENSRTAEITKVTEKSSQNSDQSFAEVGKGMTRRGRIIKSPRQYWKGNESILSGIRSNGVKSHIEICLDDSMTLRNRKVVDKKKTPPLKNNSSGKNPPLTTISENEPSDFKKPESRKKIGTKVDKENSLVREKKPGRKKNNSADKLKASKQTKKDVAEKAPSKRKSGSFDAAVSKKKKVEDLPSEIYSEDELFGEMNLKKSTYPSIQYVSPSLGLHSAKKAVDTTDRATPLCKDLGQFMLPSPATSTGSNHLPPKQNPVVKRLRKAKENCGKKTKTAVKNNTETKKETTSDVDKLMEKLTCYTSTTPLSTGTITVFRGLEQESDDNDIEDESDSDLM